MKFFLIAGASALLQSGAALADNWAFLECEMTMTRTVSAEGAVRSEDTRQTLDLFRFDGEAFDRYLGDGSGWSPMCVTVREGQSHDCTTTVTADRLAFRSDVVWVEGSGWADGRTEALTLEVDLVSMGIARRSLISWPGNRVIDEGVGACRHVDDPAGRRDED